MLHDPFRRPDFFEFDADHELAPDELCLLWEDLSNLPIDHVSGQRCTLGASSNRMFWEENSGQQVMGWNTGNTADQAYIILPNGGLSHSTTTQWSISWLGATTATNGGNRGVWIGEHNTTIDYIWTRDSGRLSINDGAQRILAPAVDIDWHRLAWNTVVFTAPGYDFYRDGIYVGSVAVCASDIYLPHVGNAFTSTAFNFAGWLGAIYAHGRPLQAAEIAALHNEPYQFLRPAMPDLLAMAVAAAGGGFEAAWAARSNVIHGGGVH